MPTRASTKALKEALIDDVDAFIKPLREKRASIAADEKLVQEVLRQGSVRANERAHKKMLDVKEKIGVL
jgi:tryptophanyl-tRNA synthetase